MAQTVIVGLDGSLESRAAAGWAAREAQRRGLPLHLVHALPTEQVPDGAALDDPAVREHWGTRVVREVAEEIAVRHPDVAVTTEQVGEWAVTALVDRSEDAALVVLGSRGYGAVAGFLVGSVGHQVLGRAKCPVVTVRRNARAETEAVGADVVVGVQEVGEAAKPLLEFAFAAAAERRAGLRAVRAWSLPPVFVYSPASLYLLDEAGGMEPFERKLLADAVRPWREKYPDVPVTEQVELGNAAEILLTAAADAALVVVGRRTHRPPLAGRLGHVAHAALHHAACPVAVVPHD